MLDNKYFNQPKVALPEETGTPLTAEALPPFVRTKETGDKIYLVENGNFHWIKNPQAYQAVGGDFGKEQMIEYKVLRTLKQGVPITPDNAEKYKVAEKKEETTQTEVFVSPEEEVEEIESAPKQEPVKGFTSIIIPAYLKDYSLVHYTGNCIGSIREHTDKGKTPYEIILVLNGPSVSKFENLALTYADKVIELPENVGYAKAVNRAIRAAKGEYVVIMNNDVQVFDGWLDNFQVCLGELDLVMASPMYGKPFARAVEADFLMSLNIGKLPKETFSTDRDFSCVATRKDLFDQIGLFDENFFAYKEDVDFLNRMEKAGKKFASTRLVNTHHIIGATSLTLTPVELKRDEGTKYYNEKYPKV